MLVRSRGFTIMELMIVVAIIGIAGVVVAKLTIPDGNEVAGLIAIVLAVAVAAMAMFVVQTFQSCVGPVDVLSVRQRESISPATSSSGCRTSMRQASVLAMRTSALVVPTKIPCFEASVLSAVKNATVPLASCAKLVMVSRKLRASPTSCSTR